MRKLKYLYYRFIWLIAPFLKYGKIIHLDLELNNNCNQKCLSCWHNSETSFVKSVRTDLEYIKTLLKIFRANGAMSVKFNLRGEPLLSPILIDCIEYAKEFGYVDIMINTNGILLTHGMALKLSEAGLTTLIISVDSFDPKTYCKIHNCNMGMYSLLRLNLLTLKVFYMENAIKYKTKLNFHINKYNENENILEGGNGYWRHMEPVIRNTQKRKGKDISLKTKERKRKKSCPHMKRRVTMLTDGSIYPCCVCYDSPADILLLRIEDRKKLIDNYAKGIYTKTCAECTSEDIWK